MSVFRNLLMAQGKKRRLPYGYAEVEYIENPTDAYIDTQIKANGRLSIKSCSQIVSLKESVCVFGSRLVGLHKAFNLFHIQKDYLRLDISDKQFFCSKRISGKIEIVYEKNKWSVNNIFADYPAFTDFDSDLSLYLFCINEKGSPVKNFNGRIFYFTIKENDVLLRNYIPCINPSGIVGMYDLVEGKFYGSETSTQFIAGPIEVPAETYIEDGLAFHLDCRDAKASEADWIWEDRIGKIPFTMKSVKQQEDKGLVFDGVKSYGVGNVEKYPQVQISSTEGTIELAFIIDDDAGRGMVIDRTRVEDFFILYNTNNTININGIEDSAAIKGGKFNLISKKGTLSRNNLGCFQNKKKLSYESTDGIGIANVTNITIGAQVREDLTLSRFFLKGKIYSIRIYNRQLTKEEMLHNQQVDIDTFFGGVTPQ